MPGINTGGDMVTSSWPTTRKGSNSTKPNDEIETKDSKHLMKRSMGRELGAIIDHQ